METKIPDGSIERPDEIRFSMLFFLGRASLVRFIAPSWPPRSLLHPQPTITDAAPTAGVKVGAVDVLVVTTLVTYSLNPP